MYLMIATRPAKTSLYLYRRDGRQLAQSTWSSDRQLSDRILIELKQLLEDNQQTFTELAGIGVLAGPGHFTALRIVHVLANTLAYALTIPAVNAQDPDWIKACLKQLAAIREPTSQASVIIPSYGKLPQITSPRK